MKQYNVLYADCPWQYDNQRTGGSLKSGASQQYPTLSTDELCALPISLVAAKDSVLFMWATVPLLEDAQRVMKAWGYKYKTFILWHKTGRKGLGFWWRGEAEVLLFGIKGKKIRPFRMNESNVVQHPVLRHSEKPDVFRQKIERAANKAELHDRVELFARVHATGWDVWGHDVHNSFEFTHQTTAP